MSEVVKTKVTVSCCFCATKTAHFIEMPVGWALRYHDIEAGETDGFCPDHAPVAKFAESQCPGCVGGWGDCGLWRAFAYSGRRTLTEDDFAQIGRGICPKRVNGTIGMSRAGMHDIDLSAHAKTDIGVALVSAIREYLVTYPD